MVFIMIVSCPKCKTKYVPPSEALGTQSRRFKCAVCGNIFGFSGPTSGFSGMEKIFEGMRGKKVNDDIEASEKYEPYIISRYLISLAQAFN